MNITIAEDQKMFFSPFRILIEDTNELNQIADARQKAHGEVTYFDYDNPDNNYDGWYDFYIDTNGKEVTSMYYESFGSYIDKIELTEEDKVSLIQQIVDYYGGEDEYETICEKWRL